MARKTIDGTPFREASSRSRVVSASGAQLNKKRLVRPRQAMLTDARAIVDKGSDALIETHAPVHELEVTKQKPALPKAKTKAANPKINAKKVARPKAKPVKSKAPKPKVLGKVAPKSGAKSVLKKEVSPKVIIAAADAKDALHSPALVSTRTKNIQSSPPWCVVEQSEDTEMLPLPRHAALQVYEKTNWLASIGFWMRSNVRPLFVRRQKAVNVTRPAPQKLQPRDMIAELNRLSEENRALRRKLSHMRGDKE